MQFYLSDADKIEKACELTGLALDEIEFLVGRFAKHSCRAGLLRGEVLVEGERVIIRHHFTKKLLWSGTIY